MKVVILGKGEMLANLIEGVNDSGFEIAGVFRHERTSIHPFKLLLSDFFKSSPEVTMIKERKLYEIKCKSANSKEFKKELLKLNPDIMLVGTWGEKLKKEIFDIPKIAAINVHPSLLPAYRGPNPYIQTILHGEKQSGVTFHLITEKLDAGPILAQQKIDILPVDTAKELKSKTVFAARIITCELLKKLNAGIVQERIQNENEASYFPNITGDEKMLDFKSQTSDEILRTIRALYPYLPAYITYEKMFFIVNPYKARLTDKTGMPGEIIAKCPKTRSLTICCKDGIAVKMSGLKLYGLPIFTGFCIKLAKEEGEKFHPFYYHG